MSKQKQTYTEALAELEKILEQLENNTELTMESISEKVSKAAELIKICKKQLFEIDKDMEKILEELD